MGRGGCKRVRGSKRARKQESGLPKFYQTIPSTSAKWLYIKVTQKSVAFLYRNDKWAEKEIMETMPFTIDKNNIKYIGVTNLASKRSV